MSETEAHGIEKQITKEEADEAFYILASQNLESKGIVSLSVLRLSEGDKAPVVTNRALAETRRNLAKEMVLCSEDKSLLGDFDSFEDLVLDLVDKAQKSSFYVPEDFAGSYTKETDLKKAVRYGPPSEMIDLIGRAMKSQKNGTANLGGPLSIDSLERAKKLANGENDDKQNRYLDPKEANKLLGTSRAQFGAMRASYSS